MSKAIIPTHARIGVCALCNFNDWVVFSHDDVKVLANGLRLVTPHNICVDTQDCAERVAYQHDVAVRAELILEIHTLCDDHLLACWNFVRTNGVTKSHGECRRCAEETADDFAWSQVDDDIDEMFARGLTADEHASLARDAQGGNQ